MEEPTLATRNVFMTILLQILHFMKSQCKSPLNLKKNLIGSLLKLVNLMTKSLENPMR